MMNKNVGICLCIKDILGLNVHKPGQSESVNSCFDNYVHPKTTLKKIIQQFKIVLGHQCDKESHGDYESFSSTIPCVYDYIEKQFWAYTNAKFCEV